MCVSSHTLVLLQTEIQKLKSLQNQNPNTIQVLYN